MISPCTATRILYVLPDNVSDVNCPSQPCATLGHYLLDNGSLPVLSNVEYHFLPGKHQVVDTIDIEEAFNFSLIGCSLSQTKFVCWSQAYVRIFLSYNVTIRNLVFDQCNGVLFSEVPIPVAPGLFLYECSHCVIKDLVFFGYGFLGMNLFLNSYISNVTINITTMRPGVRMCSAKFYLWYLYVEGDHDQILITQLFITGYNKLCYNAYKLMKIKMYNSYNVSVELCDSHFYAIDQIALYILIKNASNSLIVKNCRFEKIIQNFEEINIFSVIHGTIPINNVAITFENCTFYSNSMSTIRIFFSHESFCVNLSSISIKNCDVTENIGEWLELYNDASNCKPFVFLNGIINITKNRGSALIKLENIVTNINGTITVWENKIIAMMKFYFCVVTFTKTITFISNICDTVIYMTSYDMQYIVVVEFANITFINTTYHDLFTSEPITAFVSEFPFCFFQYMAQLNNKSDIYEMLSSFTITFIRSIIEHTYLLNDFGPIWTYNIGDFLTHCKWLDKSLFKDYDPGYINQQIMRVNAHPWIHHKSICHCPNDGPYDCTVDLLGPVYPGQKLQVELCIPQGESDEGYNLNVETHSSSLPNSTCKLVHQSELVSTIRNYSEPFNFTVISDIEFCELFLTAHPFFRAVFYVQLLPCPVGFTLQNGVCNCDPLLPPDIDTCYIDLSAIRRPANTWITAHTVANNVTNYLISDCPMDYCLPYSTNVNLLYPDLQCQFNRIGLLCSQCQHPLSMVFGSSSCMKCTNVHILITIIVLVAGIVLVVLLYVLNLTVTNGTINGIIFYANIISINDSVFLVKDNVFKPLRVFISFINLDLGIETCFYNGMDSYAKMWLQLFFPSYLILIAVSIIIASRYSSRILRLTYSRSLPVLATLFLLSYTGVLRVVLTALFSYSTISHYPSGDKQIVWSIDASVPLFGLQFTILFITCLVLFLLLIPFNITLLFTRYLSRFRVVNHFKPLLDAFQGSYKDEYYYWIAVQLIFRSIFFSLYAFQIKLNLILATITLVIFTGYYGYLRPNKNKIVNFQELSLLINLTILYAVSIQENLKIFFIITNIMISLTLTQFGIIALGHFVIYTCHRKFSIKEKFFKIFSKKKLSRDSFDVALLDIPDRTYDYSEYQDGLVSDDFKDCK